MLLWTPDVTRRIIRCLKCSKVWDNDGVELPIFELDVARFKIAGGQSESFGLIAPQ